MVNVFYMPPKPSESKSVDDPSLAAPLPAMRRDISYDQTLKHKLNPFQNFQNKIFLDNNLSNFHTT